MLESTLQRNIQKALKSRGFWVLKTHGDIYIPQGTPDILACINGRFFAFEVKVDPHDDGTDLQKLTLERIRIAGGVGAVVHSVEEVLDVCRAANVRI